MIFFFFWVTLWSIWNWCLLLWLWQGLTEPQKTMKRRKFFQSFFFTDNFEGWNVNLKFCYAISFNLLLHNQNNHVQAIHNMTDHSRRSCWQAREMHSSDTLDRSQQPLVDQEHVTELNNKISSLNTQLVVRLIQLRCITMSVDSLITCRCRDDRTLLLSIWSDLSHLLRVQQKGHFLFLCSPQNYMWLKWTNSR